MKELFVSLEAIINESSDIVFGNIIGSNIANIALVLGWDETFTYLSNGDDGFGLVFGDQELFKEFLLVVL